MAEDSASRKLAGDKKPYTPPRILVVEPLEAVAVDCTNNGKDAPGAPGPGGTCTFANS
jgi:hypothetical protein